MGTFALCFVGAGSAAATAADASFGRLLFVAAVFGGVVALAIVAFGRVSGAFINPAVALGGLVRGDLRPRQFALYFLVQLGAALAAGLALLVVFDEGPNSGYLGSTSLAESVSAPLGLALEIAGTFTLAVVAFSSPRLGSTPARQAALIGGTLFLLILVVGPMTGASLNPARSAGPAVVAGYLENLWLYFAGPLAGGLLAGLVTRPRPPK